jgi:hypothetical protein
VKKVLIIERRRCIRLRGGWGGRLDLGSGRVRYGAPPGCRLRARASALGRGGARERRGVGKDKLLMPIVRQKIFFSFTIPSKGSLGYTYRLLPRGNIVANHRGKIEIKLLKYLSY